MNKKLRPITKEALQSLITRAIRESHPECRAFAGVVVERVHVKSRGGPNWFVKGVKYGDAKREECRAAIDIAVERLQQEVFVSDE